MFDIGFPELLLCGVIALLVIGPERLPEAARTVGRWAGRARKFTRQISEEFEREVELKEMRQRIEEEKEKLGLENPLPSLRQTLEARYNATPPMQAPDNPEEFEASLAESVETVTPPSANHAEKTPHIRLVESGDTAEGPETGQDNKNSLSG